jgi:hypothetical protein
VKKYQIAPTLMEVESPKCAKTLGNLKNSGLLPKSFFEWLEDFVLGGPFSGRSRLATGRWTVSQAQYEFAEAPDADCRKGYRSARINVQGSREDFGSEQI